MSIFNRFYNNNDNDLLTFPSNNDQYNLALEQEKNKHSVWKILSLICFGLGLSSKFAFLFSIPLNLLGILFAIIHTFLKKKICWLGFLNVLGIVVFLLVSQFTLSNFIASYPQEILETPDISFKIEEIPYQDNIVVDEILKIRMRFLDEIEEQISQLQGNWTLADEENSNNIVKCTFKNDNSFACSKYGEEEKTYAKGTYKIKSLSIEGNDWNPIALSDFEWEYSIETTINDCSINGVIQEKPLLEKYNIEILANKDVYESEGFFTNSNYSYSGKRSK